MKDFHIHKVRCSFKGCAFFIPKGQECCSHHAQPDRERYRYFRDPKVAQLFKEETHRGFHRLPGHSRDWAWQPPPLAELDSFRLRVGESDVPKMKIASGSYQTLKTPTLDDYDHMEH